MKKRFLLAIVLVLVIIIGFWFLNTRKISDSGLEQKTISQEKQKELLIDISLKFIQGVNGQGSLLKIRLFSRKLLQQDIDKKVLNTDKGKQIESLVVSCPEDFWNKSVTVMLSEKGKKKAEYHRPETEVQLIRAPEEKIWTFTPGKIYEALYEIPSSVILSPGTHVWIAATLGKERLRSNDIIVPSPPTGEKERLIQEASVFIYLENAEEVLRVAEKLISSFPDDSSGYWFKGMVLEITGNEESALAAYEQALKNFPLPGKEGNVEPPLRLVEKMRKLRSLAGEYQRAE